MTMAQLGLLVDAASPQPAKAQQGSLAELAALSQMRVV
jgi:hypothetical protein